MKKVNTILKKATKIVNNIVKFDVPAKIMNTINYYSIYIYMLFLLIPRIGIQMFPDYRFQGLVLTIIIMFLVPFLYVFIYNIKHKNVAYTLDFLFLTLFLAFSLCSCIFSNNFFRSFEGTGDRREGFVTLLIYYLVYMNARCLEDKKDIMNLIELFLFVGMFQVFIGFIETYFLKNMFLRKSFDHMAYGYCGNPNFFGSYTMMLCLVGLGLCLFYKDHTKYHVVATIVLYIGLVMAQSTGPFLSFCFCLIIVMIFAKKKKINKDKITIWLAIFVSLYAITNYSLIYVNRNIYHINFTPAATISGDIDSLSRTVANKASKLLTGKELIQASTANTENIGSGRTEIWKRTFRYIKDKNVLLFGTGLDNYEIIIYEQTKELQPNKTHISPLLVDKAHNCYLNILVTSGIFSLIEYLAWTFIVHKDTIKSKNPLVYIILIAFIGYNIQSLFNISLIEVATYYYALAGLMMGIALRES